MSSPIASEKKGPLGRALIAVHQRLSHGHRVQIVSRRIAGLIQAQFPGAREIRCLDVGCGDMQIAEHIAAAAPGTSWSCIDIHELPESLKTVERWQKYRKFDGSHVPFADDSFDVVLFCDVLHHSQTDACGLLGEAARAGCLVIIKDHFERSPWSRAMLWTMDFLGNWGYGVSLPRRYFTRRGFEELVSGAGLRVQKLEVGIDLYAQMPLIGAILRPEWQFIALLGRGAA
jgi:SAM-dependent methyltransferase